MPEISRFYGIIIRMYYDEHPPPHFHVSYQGIEATVRIDTLQIAHGRLPVRAFSLVREWAVAHREELHQNWRRAEAGEPVTAIAPLD